MSWISATSPMRRTTGPSSTAAHPKAVETVPSIPLAPRLASTRGGCSRAGKNVSTSRTGIEDATTTVASGGSSDAQLGGDPRFAQSGGGERAGDRRGGRRSARVPAVEPVAVGAALHLGGDRVERRARVGREDRRDGAGRVLPGVLGVEADLQRVVEAVQPAPQRLGGGEVADAQHEVGRVRGRPLGVAQQRVVVRDRGRAAAGAGQRVGEQRDRRPSRRSRRARRAGRGSRSARPATMHRARAGLRSRPERLDQRRRRLGGDRSGG